MIKALRSVYLDYDRDLYNVIGSGAAQMDTYVDEGTRKQASLSVLGQFPVMIDTDLFQEALLMYVEAYISELATAVEVGTSDARVMQRSYGARGTTNIHGAGSSQTTVGNRKSKDKHGATAGTSTTTEQPDTTTVTESFASAGGPNVAPVRREARSGKILQESHNADTYTDEHTEDGYTTTATEAARTDTSMAQAYIDTETQTVTAPERADLMGEQWDRAFAILRRWLADAVVYAQAVRW